DGIERPNRFDAQQLEPQLRLHHPFQGPHRRLRAAAQLARLRDHAVGLARELPPVGPGQHDLGATAPARKAVEREVLEAQALGLAHASRSAKSRERRSEEHTSELQSRFDLVCRLLLEKKKPIATHTLLHTFALLLLPRPPRPTLFPYTTLFRSHAVGLARELPPVGPGQHDLGATAPARKAVEREVLEAQALGLAHASRSAKSRERRSEERRVGKECRAGWGARN